MQMVKVFEGNGEVLVFAVDHEGNVIGEKEYFTKDDPDRDDYDVTFGELPLVVKSRGLVSQLEKEISS